MSLKDVPVGYCRHCNKEVEVRDGVLIVHDVTYNGGRCRGGGKAPSAPPREGGWEPPLRPAKRTVPDYTPPPRVRPQGADRAVRALWEQFFRRVREG